MKKLTLIPIAITLLTACTSSEPSPVENVNDSQQQSDQWQEGANNLASGEQMASQIQPQVSTQAQEYDNSFHIPRDSNGKIQYNKIQKGSYTAQKYKVNQGDSLYLISYISGKSESEIAQLNNLKKPYNLKVGQELILNPNATTSSTRSSTRSNLPESMDVTIPRNKQTNKPEYNKIEKGFYQARTYKVRKGDTLYLVSYISGQDVEDLARLNNIKPPYDLHVGQIIKLEEPMVEQTQLAQSSAPSNNAQAQAEQPVSKPKIDMNNLPQNVKWQWPTKGEVIGTFSPTDGGNKGIDIAGKEGQPVRAAAAGQVVYAGNALQGYGNLIIIKHNNDYLSAYAHNSKILVKDKEMVTAGQEIAEMGSTGTDKVKLHFEVRYKGQSADPLKFLPKQ